MIGASAASFSPTTTRTKSAADERERIAAESKVSLPAVCPATSGGHGSRALSRPMREDCPAARITPAKLAARVMQRRYQGKSGNCRFLDCSHSIAFAFPQQSFLFFKCRVRHTISFGLHVSRAEPTHMRYLGTGMPPDRDQLCRDRNRNLFRRHRPNVDSDGGMNALEKMCIQSFLP